MPVQDVNSYSLGLGTVELYRPETGFVDLGTVKFKTKLTPLNDKLHCFSATLAEIGPALFEKLSGQSPAVGTPEFWDDTDTALTGTLEAKQASLLPARTFTFPGVVQRAGLRYTHRKANGAREILVAANVTPTWEWHCNETDWNMLRVDFIITGEYSLIFEDAPEKVATEPYAFNAFQEGKALNRIRQIPAN